MVFIKENKKSFAIIIGITFALVLFLSIALMKEEAIAKVDGEAISKDELYEEMAKTYGAATVDQIITDKIVEAEAKIQKITITEAELTAEIDKLKDSYGGDEVFEQMLESNNTTVDQIKEDLKDYLTIKKLLEPQIKITDEEMKTYFEENKDSFGEPEQVNASHILVADETIAKEIKAKLDAGGDFAELAKEYSTDEGSKENGGELGYFPKGTMVAEFEEVAFSLEVNKISDPVKSDYGYHIIKVQDKKEAKEAAYEESKEEIKATLMDQRLETEYTTWLEEKKKDYDIENTFETKAG